MNFTGSQKTIKEIIRAGTYAPSGENCQPWRFVVDENKIRTVNIPERDKSLYNFNQHASLVAHGSLIENISIASSVLGFKVLVSLMPDKSQPYLTAKIDLNKENFVNTKDKDLFQAIYKRSTNRKTYDGSLLTNEEENILKSAARHLSGAKLALVSSKSEIEDLASLMSMNERLIFENKRLHGFLFGHLRWTEKEEAKKKNGLYLKTLELKPPQVISFRLFKHWKILNFMNKLGVSKFIAKENAKIYSSASAIGIIFTDGNGDADYLNAGRVMQRVWLEATNVGLSIQPVTGIIFLAKRVMAKNLGGLSRRHADLISDAYNNIKGIFNLKNETIMMLFRVGHGGSPSAQSSRLPAEILFL